MYRKGWSDEKKKEVTKDLIIYLSIVAVFALLRIFGIISWSWWIILLPIYGPIVYTIILTLCLYYGE